MTTDWSVGGHVRSSLFGICIATCVLSSSRVLAHEPPEIRRILWNPAQAEVLLQTNRGLIFGDPSSNSWQLLCNEAMRINGGELPSLAYLSDGRLLVATSSGLRASSDRGCNWTVTFEGLLVPALAQDVNSPERLFVATFPLGMASENIGGDSAIRVSTDGGRTFRDVRVMADNDFVNALRVAPSRGERVYASGTVYRNIGREFYLARSDDGGETWQRFVLPLTVDDNSFHVMAVSPTDPDVVIAKIGPNNSVTMPERLLVSTDGGETFESLVSLMALRDVGFAADGTTIWAASGDGLFRSADRGGAFARVGVGDYMTCAVEHEEALYACGWYGGEQGARSNGVGRSTDDGESFQAWMTFQDVTRSVTCLAGSMTAALCASALADWQYELINMFSAESLNRDGGVSLPVGSDAGAAVDAGRPPDATAPGSSKDAGRPTTGRTRRGGCTARSVDRTPSAVWLVLMVPFAARLRRRAAA